MNKEGGIMFNDIKTLSYENIFIITKMNIWDYLIMKNYIYR